VAQEAQLKMLRYQLNPHFLFNTLNAISTLILDKDTELANSMVTKLSRFLRYSLVSDPMASVTVAEEVASLKLYLDIEKVRFGDRLTLKFDIDKAAEQALMPSLLLQPLVENAIKYAISQAIQGGYIAVTARVVDQTLELSVADDGPGMDLAVHPKTGSGVGLANTRERLLQRYGDAQSLTLSDTDPHGVTVNVLLPLEYGERSP
jgi:LytS/YehU family sensor histidine kinase